MDKMEKLTKNDFIFCILCLLISTLSSDSQYV